MRDGHSLLIISVGLGEDGSGDSGEVALIFGGRGPEGAAKANPLMFETAEINGSLVFTSYAGLSVTRCPPGSPNYGCDNITVGLLRNDLWALDLGAANGGGLLALASNSSSPGAAHLVNSSGARGTWVLLDGGAPLGGLQHGGAQGAEPSHTHPSERFGHAAAAFSDGRIAIYGGYSPLCEDYCADLWTLNVRTCLLARSNALVSGGEVAHMTATTSAYVTAAAAAAATAACAAWVRAEAVAGPAARWRMASTQVGDDWYIFGGQRLWQGFSPGAEAANGWATGGAMTIGGMLDDLWRLRYVPGDLASAVSPASGGRGGFIQITPRESCSSLPPAAPPKPVFDATCEVIWPRARIQAAMAATGAGATAQLYLHGGYSVAYPYPQTLGAGAGPGTAAAASDGPRPYSGQPYLLADMWRFDVVAGLWTLLAPAVADAPTPSPRLGHSLTALASDGGVLLLFGGQADDGLQGDTWLFSLRAGAWVLKSEHVIPLLPPGCASDVVATPEAASLRKISGRMTSVSDLEATTQYAGRRGMPLEAVRNKSVAIAPARVDAKSAPRRAAPGWDGCRDRVDGRSDLPNRLQWLAPAQRVGHAAAAAARGAAVLISGGEALAFEAAPSRTSTPLSADAGDVWAFRASACAAGCHGRGTCTLGHCQCKPGWQGTDCSNMSCPGSLCAADGLTGWSTRCVHCASLPHVHRVRELLSQPSVNRAQAWRLAHVPALAAAGLWDDAVLDPLGDARQHSARKSALSLPAAAASAARTRYLFDGAFAGGAAAAPSERAEEDAWAAASRISHGVCDGFGQCICAPPFLGDDCSVLGCPSPAGGGAPCSGRGLCALEYPVAHCNCEPPYAGTACELILCPNNCSWPRGTCAADGVCSCGAPLNPFDRAQVLPAYGGPDCSYELPFARATSNGAVHAAAVALAVATAAMLVTADGSYAFKWHRRH